MNTKEKEAPMSEEAKAGQEQPQPKSKAELFAENPDNFIDISEIVICIVRSPQGPAMLCKPINRAEAIMARGECDIALFKTIMENDLRNKQSQVVTPPKGGIINAVRKGMFRR